MVKLRERLDEKPVLMYARSPRLHRATLLISCAANGTERECQRTPGNIAAIAQLLLECGAEVDAVSHLYGGGVTTLLLLLTDVFPGEAGVTGDGPRPVLVQAGARVNTRADYPAMMAAIDSQFSAAAGRLDVLETLLSQGIDVNTWSFQGSTAFHAAADPACLREEPTRVCAIPPISLPRPGRLAPRVTRSSRSSSKRTRQAGRQHLKREDERGYTYTGRSSGRAGRISKWSRRWAWRIASSTAAGVWPRAKIKPR